MKNSQDWSEMLAGYVLGDLSSEEMIEVQRYLAEHPNAMTELAELQQTLALLPLGLPNVAVPEELRAKILNKAIGRSAIEPTPIEPTPIELTPVTQSPQVIDLAAARSQQEPRPQRYWSVIGGGIAAAMIAALGVQNYQLQQQVQGVKQEIASLQQVDRETDQMAKLAANNGKTLTMRGSGPVTGAAGKVYIVPQQNRALLAIENLPQPPAGKVYHLWAVVNGQKVSCVQFTPERNGKVVMQIPANRWLQAVEVRVTLEAEQPNVMPAGEMVMQGEAI